MITARICTPSRAFLAGRRARIHTLAAVLLASAATACGSTSDDSSATPPAGSPDASQPIRGGPDGAGSPVNVDATSGSYVDSSTTPPTGDETPVDMPPPTGSDDSSSPPTPVDDSGSSPSGDDAGGGALDAGNSPPPPVSDSGIFNPAFILGADVSWTTQHESEGYTYSDGKSVMPMEQILTENGFNYMRLRTFVDPSASDGYSRGQQWCGKADTIAMAKRAKRCGMGVFVDFHMSDTWASLGTNANPATMPIAWRNLSQTVPSTPVSAQTHLTNNLFQTAHDYVADVMQGLVAAGAKPDMVQIGNETNTGMSGISMSNWPVFSALVNAGIKAVRETDPNIVVWAQNGRPRPDNAGGSNFTGWVDDYLSGKAPHVPAIDEDGICGSTYGTTNGGADWTTSFTYITSTYHKFVASCEYTDKSPDAPAGAIINALMRNLPNKLGRGSFIWEPADYPAINSSTLFTQTGKVYTANSLMAEYPVLAKSYGLPVPAATCK